MKSRFSQACVVVLCLCLLGCNHVTKSDLEELLDQNSQPVTELAGWAHEHTRLHKGLNKTVGDIDRQQKEIYEKQQTIDGRVSRLEGRRSIRPSRLTSDTPEPPLSPSAPPLKVPPAEPEGLSSSAANQPPPKPEPSPSDLPIPGDYEDREESDLEPAPANTRVAEQPPEKSSEEAPRDTPRIVYVVSRPSEESSAKEKIWRRRYNRLHGKVDEVNGRIDEVNGRVHETNERVSTVETHLSGFQQELEKQNERISSIEGKVDGISSQLSGFIEAARQKKEEKSAKPAETSSSTPAPAARPTPVAAPYHTPSPTLRMMRRGGYCW